MQNSVHWSTLLTKTFQFLTPYSKPALLYTNYSVSFSIQQEVEIQSLIHLWVWNAYFINGFFLPLLLHSKPSLLCSRLPVLLLLFAPVPWPLLPCHLATGGLPINSVSICVSSLPIHVLGESHCFFPQKLKKKELYFVKKIPCSSCKVN